MRLTEQKVFHKPDKTINTICKKHPPYYNYIMSIIWGVLFTFLVYRCFTTEWAKVMIVIVVLYIMGRLLEKRWGRRL